MHAIVRSQPQKIRARVLFVRHQTGSSTAPAPIRKNASALPNTVPDKSMNCSVKDTSNGPGRQTTEHVPNAAMAREELLPAEAPLQVGRCGSKNTSPAGVSREGWVGRTICRAYRQLEKQLEGHRGERVWHVRRNGLDDDHHLIPLHRKSEAVRMTLRIAGGHSINVCGLLQTVRISCREGPLDTMMTQPINSREGSVYC